MGFLSCVLDAAVTTAGVAGKVLAQGAIEGGKLGYELGKATGEVAKETAKGAWEGTKIAGKVLTGQD